MYKKSILSIAIASSLMLTGCFENNKLDDENAGVQTPQAITASEGSAYPAFNPAISDIPIPNDLIFDKVAQDGTFEVPDTKPPVTTALNQLSGASTVAPIDIKILSGEVDGDTLAGNVYLLELAYASGSPLQGLSIGEPPTIAGAANVALEHIVLDGDSYIRINPKTPLKPNTRYEVVITNGVKDTLGEPLVRNPGVASYAALSDLNVPLANPALAPVQKLINRLWEPTAVAFFNAAVNPAREAAELEPLDDSNIVLSYTLTTSGDEKVLNYIADPAQWFSDQITTFVSISAVKAMMGSVIYESDGVTIKEDYRPADANAEPPREAGARHNPTLYAAAGGKGSPDYATIQTLLNTAVFPAFPSAGIQAALNPLFSAPPPAGCQGTTGSLAIGCIATALTSVDAPNGFKNLLPTPASTLITFDDTSALDINEVSSLTASLGIASGLVSVVQGKMTIPYYAAVPTGSNGAPLITDSWVADDTLATAINSAFAPLGLQIPQADPTVTTAVNYIFPFPKKKDDVTIPVLGIHPTNPAGTMKSVMYQHGITTDRSAALAFGASMVAGAKTTDNGVDANGFDVGVIAIDQPLHGIDGISEEGKLDLAGKLLASGQSGGLPANLAPSDVNNQALVDKTLATNFVTASLNGAGIIDTSDGLDGTEESLIAGAFDNTLAQSVVTGKLHAAGVINIADGISPQEEFLIGTAFDGSLTSTVITSQLATNNVIDTSNGISPQEQSLIDAVIAGVTENPALAPFEAAAASLSALEVAATTTLPGLQKAAQALELMQTTVTNGASVIPGLPRIDGVEERHFGFTSAGAGVAPNAMDYDGSATYNSSGSLFINLTSFLTSRDNLREQVLDLLAVRKSLGTVDMNGAAANGDMSTSDVYFFGHSLGTINSLPFVAVANNSATASDNIVAANMMTPGSGITRLLENSQSFSTPILGGLARQGFTQDTFSFQGYMNVLQAALDTVDPANFVTDIGEDNQNTPVLFTLVVDDATIPNSVDTTDEVLGDGSVAFMSGSEPLADLIGATQLTSADEDVNPVALGQREVRFNSEGGKVSHGTPLFPSSGTDEEKAAFAEMVGQGTSIVLTSGTGVRVANGNVIE